MRASGSSREHGFRGALASYQKVFPQFAEVRLRLRLMSAGSGAVSARELVAGGEWRFAGGVATVDVPPETVRMLSFPR